MVKKHDSANFVWDILSGQPESVAFCFLENLTSVAGISFKVEQNAASGLRHLATDLAMHPDRTFHTFTKAPISVIWCSSEMSTNEFWRSGIAKWSVG